MSFKCHRVTRSDEAVFLKEYFHRFLSEIAQIRADN